MTIPNILTVGRIFLTPVLIWLILDHRLNSALFLFLVAGLSDAFDGYLARKLDQRSRFGAFVDPLADKILLVSSFVLLWWIGLVPWWLLAITAGRDLMILGGCLYFVFAGIRVEMDPLFVSKMNTLFQLITVFLLLGSDLVLLPSWMYTLLFLVTAGLCAYSGWRYYEIGRSLLGSGRNASANP